MSRKQEPHSRGKSPKGEADRRFRAIADKAKCYKGRCLFPSAGSGGLCPEPPSRRHVIPRSAVLDVLKDGKSGKVLDLDWGVDQWAALLLKSDKGHPVNLEDPVTFEPRSLGTHEACTGLYACRIHDAVFNPIDTGTPDFSNPYTRWLTMGRITLYAGDLCSRRKFLVDTWKPTTVRSGSRGLRASWMRESQLAETAYEKAHAGVRRWGSAWQSLESPGKLPDNPVDWSVLSFRSKLRMAACIYYGQATTVVVLPGNGDDHRMALLYWSEENSRVAVDEEQLANRARESEVGDDYGVDMLNELMSRGSGAVAASPESYRELPGDQKTEVQKILMRGLEATGIAQALREDHPDRGASGNRPRRGRSV